MFTRSTLIIGFAIVCALFASCGSEIADVNDLVIEEPKPIELVEQVLQDTANCPGVALYAEANDAYFESLRNYEAYSNEQRDALQTKVLMADQQLEQHKESMTRLCLEKYRQLSQHFAVEMKNILLEEHPTPAR